MVDYWVDADVLIRCQREAYGLDTAPAFWAFLEEQATNGVIRCPMKVYEELIEGSDGLAKWIKERREILFTDPTEEVQRVVRTIADHVESHCDQAHGKQFLSGADPWLIAHANFEGGTIVTFEQSVPPSSPKVKIPDIADVFSVSCTSIWKMNRALGLRLD